MTSLRLHIGTHRTGSTSIQRWLADHREWLAARGYAVYEGLHIPANHVELYLAAMRRNRDSFAKQSFRGWSFGADYRALVSRRVREHLALHPARQGVFTTEGLSLLRHEDELDALQNVLGEAAARTSILLFLRNRQDYLNSYRTQLASQPGRIPATDYWSALYVEDDTWLTDYDQLVAAYARTFGGHNVTVIDFDKEVAVHGSVLPSFLAWLGIPQAEIAAAAADLAAYRFNESPAGHRAPPEGRPGG